MRGREGELLGVCVCLYLVVVRIPHPAGQLVLDGAVAGEVAVFVVLVRERGWVEISERALYRKLTPRVEGYQVVSWGDYVP